jgi:hypothetical protein
LWFGLKQENAGKGCLYLRLKDCEKVVMLFYFVLWCGVVWKDFFCHGNIETDFSGGAFPTCNAICKKKKENDN